MFSTGTNNGYKRSPILIAVTGNAGHGKDTVAQYLSKLLVDHSGLTFFDPFSARMADPLKKQVRDLFQLTEWHTNTDEGKKSTPKELNGKTVREVLQSYGAYARSIDPDIWVRKALQQMQIDSVNNDAVFISPDVRFLNEVRFLRETCRCLVVKVVRNINPYPPEVYEDISEREVPMIQESILLRNEGYLSSLHDQIEQSVLPLVLDEIQKAKKARA